MDVRCVRCGTEYELDAAEVGSDGRRVRCTACGHVFTVEPPGGAVRPWRVRRVNGDVFAFRELTTLQQWIVERKVGRDDAIGYVGRGWKRLGDIAELAAFFAVVDEAERAEAEGRESSAVLPQEDLQLEIDVVPPAEPERGPEPEPARGLAQPAAPRGADASEPAWAAAASEPEPVGRPARPEDISPAAEMPRSARRPAPASRPRRRGRGLAVVLWTLFLLAAAATAVVALWPGEVLDLLARVAPEAFSTEPRSPAAAQPEAEVAAGEEGGPVEPPEPSPSPADAEPPQAPEPVAATAGEPREAEPPAAEEPPVAEEPPAAEAPAPKANGDTPAPPPPSALSFDQLLGRADRLRRVGQVETALELYGRARDRAPDRPEPYAGQGWSYMELRAWEPAVAAFEAALERQPRYGEALIGLAESHRFAGRTDAAREAYRRYLELLPDGPDAALARSALDAL